MKVLLVFASTHGHTTRIAQRIAQDLRHEGHRVSVRRVDDAPESLERWDAVVVGGSLHREVHQRELVDWVHRHHHSIAARPNAFFSVSLSAAEHTPEAQAAVRRCIDRFVEDSEWDPDRSAALAGCLQYTRYDTRTRWLMQAMMHRGGHPDDTSRDHELTDWDEVDAFAREIAHGLDRMPVAV